MERSCLIIEGQKEVVGKVHEILVKLRHFSFYPCTVLAFKVFELPEWMGEERRNLADALETLRLVEAT